MSSTYDDLKDERDLVIKAILEMGHIPVGMEMFSAADEEQWKIIARHIEESDYYCVVVAHRYGSETGGISYTQKEYEHAVARGVPVLGFILDDGASWPAEHIEKGAAKVKKLDQFRALVKQKPVSFWKTSDDLYGKVSIALTKAMTANPREGWVRSSSIAGPEVMAELTRLSAENAKLRQAAEEAHRKSEADYAAEVNGLWDRMWKMKKTFVYKYTKRDPEWSTAKELSYGYFMYAIGPSMVSEVSVEAAGGQLAMHVRDDQEKNWWTVAQNQVRDLFADWLALGIAEPSKKKHPVADNGDYWTLTEVGRELLALSRHRLMKLDEEAPADEAPANEGPVKKAPAKKAPAKKAPAKKAPAKKAPAKKGPANKAP